MPRLNSALLLCLALTTPPNAFAQEEGADSARMDFEGAIDGGRWIELFDGATLNGWTTRGGRYDGAATWSVEDGALTGREGPGAAGGLIYTEKAYRDFELEADVWISWPFDSGFFLRMTPPERKLLGAQVTLDWRPGGEVGAIYCDGYYCHNSSGAQRYKKDAWNHFRIRCVGEPMHLIVWLNSELLTDFRIPENSGAFAQSGLIGLQVHGSEGAPQGSKVQFKNIQLRELDPIEGQYFAAGEGAGLRLTEAGRQAGWSTLFDGGSLEQFEPQPEGAGYRVRDGLLEFLVTGDSPHLATRTDHQDFQLRLDFKIAKMANSGLFLRAARDGSNPAFSGCEIQILDDFNWERETQSKLAPYQFSGGLYGSVANEKRAALRPLGEWNTFDVTYHGSRLVTYLNGNLLYDVDTHAVSVPEGTLPFAQRKPNGFIGLQRHAPGGAVEGEAYAFFRNIFVRDIGR